MTFIKKFFHLFISIGCTDMMVRVMPIRRRSPFLTFCNFVVALVCGEAFARKVESWFDVECDELVTKAQQIKEQEALNG